MAYTKYSLTPADNNAAPPNGAPEGMLPSAVNDTMRDMMSQIRDVGDGIRGGTYTMTAPVITGGSITGVALSGNTLTNPVITGGSINNTPIGASTANTGAFTTLSASSTVSGTGFSNYLASPPAIGGTAPAAGNFTTLGATGVATFSAGTVSAPAITTTGDTNTGIFFPAADTIAFTEGGVESMRIDSGGNLGIGVTPSAWSGLVGVQVKDRLAFSGFGGNSYITNNSFYGASGFTYLTTNPTSQLRFSDDIFIFANAASGTAGTAITYAERMRITSAGNVGIGATAPITRLSNTGTTWAGGIATDGFVWRSTQNDWTAAILGTPAAGAGYGLRLHTLGTTASDIPLMITSGAGSGTTLAIVTGAGNVGIGTSSPNAKVEISGTAAAQNLALRITNTATDGYSTLQLGGSGDGGVFRNGSTQTLYGGASSLNLITVGSHAIGLATGNTIRAIIPAAGGVQAVTCVSVGNATPANSGAGITFPATQSASSDANTLDDYEEGTWTPTQGAGLTVIGAFSSEGRYTKVGRLVCVWGKIAGATSVATTAGTVMCGAFPFSAAEINNVGAMNNDNRDAFGGLSIFGTTGYSATTIAATTAIYFTITYTV